MLCAARRARLAHAVLDRAADLDVTFEGYGVAKAALFDAQHQKCAWCERQTGGKYAEVEHLRPKHGAWRGDPTGTRPQKAEDPAHYWWLAWTWENLLFSCRDCNGEKACWFGLEAGSTKLVEPLAGAALDASMLCFDLTAEKPMLVDPTRENPMRHIAWVPDERRDAPERMRWIPVHRTPRGRYTIDALGLRGALTDHVTQHVRAHVWGQCVKPVIQHHAGNRYTKARQCWQNGLQSLFVDGAPYLAATFDALTFFRAQHRLLTRDFPLRPPGAPVALTAPQDDADPPLLVALPDPVRLGVRVAKNVEEAILAVRSHGPWSAADLAAMTGRKVPTVQSACRSLIARGELVARTGKFSMPDNTRASP